MKQKHIWLLHKPQKPAPPWRARAKSRHGVPTLDDGPARREVSSAQIVQSIESRGIEPGETPHDSGTVWACAPRYDVLDAKQELKATFGGAVRSRRRWTT